MNNKINTSWKHSVSRGTWRERELREGEDAFFEGLFSTVTLLGTAMAWFIIATILIWVNAMVPAYICIGIASLCIAVWVVMHVIPAVWKWLGSFVEL